MSESKVSWVPKLEALAQSAARHPEAVGLKIDSSPGLVVRDGTEEYYGLLGGLVGAAVSKQAGFREKLVGLALAKVPIGRARLREFYKKDPPTEGVNSRRGDVDSLLDFHYRAITGKLPEFIDRLTPTQSDPEKQGLELLSRRLRTGDRLLQLKILLDYYQEAFPAFGVSEQAGRLWSEAFVRRGMPELGGYRAESLTKELLENIDNYGLGSYVDISAFFKGIEYAQTAGEVYERRFIVPGSRPFPSENTWIPYKARMDNWLEHRHGYYQQKGKIAHGIKEIQASAGKNLPMEKLDEVFELFLGHPMTQNIVWAFGSKESERMTSRGVVWPDFPAIICGVKTTYEYGRSRDSSFAQDMVVLSLINFKTLASGLYNIGSEDSR